MVLLGFMSYGILCFLNLVYYFLMLGDFSAILCSYILSPFLSLLLRDPKKGVLVYLILSQKFMRLSSFLLVFSSFCSMAVISIILSFHSLLLTQLFCY